MIRIEGLIKNFGFNPVLRGLNLQVAEGEFATVVGPNGAGKSTLMRIIATLSKPSEGEVMLGGWHLPKQANRVRRHIGYVSHHPLLYGDLSAQENLHLFAKLYGLDHREKRVETAIKAVGLSINRHDPARTFSRGMWQRLAIARATLHNPDILLLDEPYTGLDQQASERFTELMQEQKNAGKTILMITHDFSRGLNLCHRIAILNRGKIQAEISQMEMAEIDFHEIYETVLSDKLTR